MRTFEAWAYKKTSCSCCKKLIKKGALIIVTYEHKRLLSIKCLSCWITN
jgi:RNase P subunit RPR2